MPDDLLIVMLCELGERILAMRRALEEPNLASKPHARAACALIEAGLSAVERHLQQHVVDALDPVSSSGPNPTALRALLACADALRALHQRLGLLDLRWSAAPVDIFLRKLRDDVGDLPHPAVVLSDVYDPLDEVAATLRDDFRAVGLAAAPWHPGDYPLVALPRVEAASPLAWPLLLPALVRLHGPIGRVDPSERAPVAVGEAPARLAGPAAFAALAAHALLFTPPDVPVWPRLETLATAAQRYSGGLEHVCDEADRASKGPVALFSELLRWRDDVLGLAEPEAALPDRDPLGSAGEAGSEPPWPEPRMPTAAEAAALLAKLNAGTPINAIDPALPADFAAHLASVGDADGFYALIDPVGERPASVATALGVGWLYKVRCSYPLFRAMLNPAESSESGRDLTAALQAYRPHMIGRDELLIQSIEAAHVHDIFARGKAEP